MGELSKVLMVVRALPFHRIGGLEYHSWDLICGLAERGIEVDVLTTRPPGVTSTALPENVRVFSLKNGKIGRYSLSYFLKVGRAARTLVSRQKSQLLHVQGFGTLGHRPPETCPLILTIHGTMFSETLLYADLFPRLPVHAKVCALWKNRWRVILHPLYGKQLQYARTIIVDSEFTREELLKASPHLEKKIELVRLGIRPSRLPVISRAQARQELGLGDDELMLLSVGRLEEQKGVKMVLEALDALRDKQIVYSVVGEGKKRSEWEAWAQRQGMRGVTFPGKLTEPDLARYYAAADLFVLAERVAPAFGLVALEALRQGVPVVASRIGALPEVVREEVGWLYDPYTVEDLRERIDFLYTNREEIAQKRKRAQAYVEERFSYQEMIERTLQVYSRIATR